MDITGSIKRKLFVILIAMGALPFTIVTIVGALDIIKEMEQNANENGLLRNLVISEHVTELFEKNFYVLHSMALNPMIIEYVKNPTVNHEVITDVLLQTNNIFKDSNLMAITGANAQQLIRTDGSDLVNISKRKHFHEAMSGNDYVSSVIVSMSTGRRIVVLEVPIKDTKGKVVGMLQRNFDLSELQHFVQTQDDDEIYVIIMDRQGRVIADSEEAVTEDTGNYKFILDKMHDKKSGVMRMKIDNEDSLVSYSKNKLTDWTIVTIKPYHYILDLVYVKISQAAVIGLIMLFIIGAIAELLSDKATKPIIEITNAADEIVSGNSAIDQITTTSKDELAQMAEAFNKMRSSRDKYQLASQLDKLTRLYNKTTMENICKIKLKQLTEEETDKLMALYIIDLDHFKETNDTLGHQHGDKVLKAFAAILRKNFRPTDCIGRFGGDEFLVIMDNLPDIEIVKRKAEQIIHSVGNMEVDGQIAGVTASIGIAIAPHQGTDYDTLFNSADEALYHVKENGRNNYYFKQI